MSEKSNNQEPKNLPVYSMGTGKQLNENAKDGVKPNFELEAKPVRCQGYWPGHNFHWIPIFRYSEPRVPITAKWIEGEKFEVEVDGKTVYWYHHDPIRLREALAKAKPGDVKATEGRPWIFISTGDGSYSFNCHDEPLKGCSVEANAYKPKKEDSNE